MFSFEIALHWGETTSLILARVAEFGEKSDQLFIETKMCNYLQVVQLFFIFILLYLVGVCC